MNCPICSSEKRPVKKNKGNIAVAVFLFLFFLLPGILYMFICTGSMHVCPDCGHKYGDCEGGNTVGNGTKIFCIVALVSLFVLYVFCKVCMK